MTLSASTSFIGCGLQALLLTSLSDKAAAAATALWFVKQHRACVRFYRTKRGPAVWQQTRLPKEMNTPEILRVACSDRRTDVS